MRLAIWDLLQNLVVFKEIDQRLQHSPIQSVYLQVPGEGHLTVIFGAW